VFAEFDCQTAEGEEFVKAARKNDKELPIIVTAPQSKKLDEVKKACPNATQYLTSPFTTQQLQKTVDQYVPSAAC
jgi:DNA-binding NtrC family response regulator